MITLRRSTKAENNLPEQGANGRWERGYEEGWAKLTLLSTTVMVKTMEEYQMHRNYCCSCLCRLHFVKDHIAIILLMFTTELGLWWKGSWSEENRMINTISYDGLYLHRFEKFHASKVRNRTSQLIVGQVTEKRTRSSFIKVKIPT